MRIVRCAHFKKDRQGSDEGTYNAEYHVVDALIDCACRNSGNIFALTHSPKPGFNLSSIAKKDLACNAMRTVLIYC